MFSNIDQFLTIKNEIYKIQKCDDYINFSKIYSVYDRTKLEMYHFISNLLHEPSWYNFNNNFSNSIRKANRIASKSPNEKISLPIVHSKYDISENMILLTNEQTLDHSYIIIKDDIVVASVTFMKTTHSTLEENYCIQIDDDYEIFEMSYFTIPEYRGRRIIKTFVQSMKKWLNNDSVILIMAKTSNMASNNIIQSSCEEIVYQYGVYLEPCHEFIETIKDKKFQGEDYTYIYDKEIKKTICGLIYPE